MTNDRNRQCVAMALLHSRFVTVGAVVALQSFLVACSNDEPHAPTSRELPPPNIVLILADDMGWSDVGSYGGEIKTPNLDSLAGEGIRFTQFYNTSKCYPSRAALLTGQYAQHVGMNGTQPASLSDDVLTIAEVLRSEGYATFMVGKHHGTDNPFDRGFDRYYGLRDGAANHFNPGVPRDGEPEPAQKKPGGRVWCNDSECGNPYTPQKGFYSTDAYTTRALQFLQSVHSEERPFFLYVSYTAPHDPLQAWPEDIAKYRGQYKSGFEAVSALRRQRQLEMGIIDNSYPPAPPSHREWGSLTADEQDSLDLSMAVYAAMIDRMDQNIGRILLAIDEFGKRDNTLVLFASDNGSSAEVVNIGNGRIGEIDRWSSLGPDWANVSNTPFRLYKNHSFEGGINTPLIVAWPNGISSPGRISRYVGHFVDILPTLIDISRATYPQSQGDRVLRQPIGESLVPVFEDAAVDRQSMLYWQWWLGRAVRDTRWKLVSSSDEQIGGNDTWQLYDMTIDKTETRDVAHEYPDQVARLKRHFDAWFATVPDSQKQTTGQRPP